MANIENNRISASLTREKQKEILALIRSVNENLGFLIALTPGERVKLPKMNKTNKLFVSDAVESAESQAGKILPDYIDVKEMSVDLNLYNILDPILLAVEDLTNKLRDTQMLAGSEAYSSALMVYKMFKFASESGVPGAKANYDNLKERFKRVSESNEEKQDEKE